MKQRLCYTCKEKKDCSEFREARSKQCKFCADAKEKRCTSCLSVKSIEDFPIMSGYRNSYCRECRAKKDREYRARPEVKAATRDKQRERYRGLSKEAKEKQSRYHKNWLSENSELVKEYNRQYRESKKVSLLILRSNQKAKSLGADRSITMKDWEYVLSLFNYKCAASKGHVIDSDNPITVDHVSPLSYDPVKNHSIWNIQPLCLRCNLIKSRRKVDFRTDEQIKKIRENCSE